MGMFAGAGGSFGRAAGSSPRAARHLSATSEALGPPRPECPAGARRTERAPASPGTPIPRARDQWQRAPCWVDRQRSLPVCAGRARCRRGPRRPRGDRPPGKRRRRPRHRRLRRSATEGRIGRHVWDPEIGVEELLDPGQRFHDGRMVSGEGATPPFGNDPERRRCVSQPVETWSAAEQCRTGYSPVTSDLEPPVAMMTSISGAERDRRGHAAVLRAGL